MLKILEVKETLEREFDIKTVNNLTDNTHSLKAKYKFSEELNEWVFDLTGKIGCVSLEECKEIKKILEKLNKEKIGGKSKC